jgi:HPt (histidine-containing phosphotransfer) domain-containing protein
VSTKPLYSEYAGDPEMEDLVREFVAGLEATCAELDNAFRQNDVGTIRRIGHQLKGTGGGYGFPSLTAAGAELERAVSRASATTAEVRAAADCLIDLCRRARASLAE